MHINVSRRGGFYLFTGLCLGLLPLHARANGLIGTSMTGSLEFGSLMTNYYDPANGYVPSGYENTAGTTVTIASPTVEFGFADSNNTDSANFSASQFTIEDSLSSTSGGTDNPFTMTFTDPAFAGQSLSKATDFFPNGLTYSLTGSTITISWAGSAVKANDDYTSTFVISAVPEPSTWAAIAVGAGALGLVVRRKRNALV